MIKIKLSLWKQPKNVQNIIDITSNFDYWYNPDQKFCLKNTGRIDKVYISKSSEYLYNWK